MLDGIEFGSVIESTTHVTIRHGRQTALARNVIVVEFDESAARTAPVCADLVWWQQLRDPHLVEIISAAQTDDGLVLVLDQASCATIQSVPRPLDRPVQALLVCQTLDALTAIHSSGHTHGGVGLHSILVDTTGGTRLALPGMAVATDAFRAPELGAAQRTVQGDLYAAGRVLETLAGADREGWSSVVAAATSPAPWDRYVSAALMRAAVESLMNEEEGRDWAAVALGGLAATASAVLVAAANTSAVTGSVTAIGSSSISAAGISTGIAVPPPPPPPPPPPAPAATSGAGPLVQLRSGATRTARRSRLIAGGIGAVAVTAAVVTGLVVFTRGTKPPAAAPATTLAPAATTIPSSAPAPVTTAPAAAAVPTTSVTTPPAAFDEQPAAISVTPGSWMWAGPAGSTITDDTVTVDGTVVAVTQDAAGTTTATGIRDGVEIWSHSFPGYTGEFSRNQPSIVGVGDSVIVSYVADGTGLGQGPTALAMTSLNAADGSERWTQKLPDANVGSMQRGPDDIVIVDADLFDDSQTAAIDSTDGHLLWNFYSTHVAGSPVAVRDDRVVISYWRDNRTTAVDIHTGQVLYTALGQNAGLAEPVLYTMNGDAFCSDPQCSLFLQGNEPTSGATLWQDSIQPGALLGVTADGAAVVRTADQGNAGVVSQLSAIDATGATKWTLPACFGLQPVATDDAAGVLMYCGSSLNLFDDRTGENIQQVPSDATSLFAVAADETLYTVVQSQVTATTLGALGKQLWSVALPAGFATFAASAQDPFIFQSGGEATAFDHRLLIRGSTTDGKPALVVITDLAFASPPPQPVPTATTPPTTLAAPTTVAPTTPPPTASPTVCIRANIDFAAVRDVPDLNGNLLAQIPPGTCGVLLVDTATAQGNGFAWYHVQWNGVDGWTAKSNTA
ncbi:MAG TPA: PQQ-binding-like beta-propeller repeat protein [Ilumatobacteraceae bacterium]